MTQVYFLVGDDKLHVGKTVIYAAASLLGVSWHGRSQPSVQQIILHRLYQFITLHQLQHHLHTPLPQIPSLYLYRTKIKTINLQESLEVCCCKQMIGKWNWLQSVSDLVDSTYSFWWWHAPTQIENMPLYTCFYHLTKSNMVKINCVQPYKLKHLLPHLNRTYVATHLLERNSSVKLQLNQHKPYFSGPVN